MQLSDQLRFHRVNRKEERMFKKLLATMTALTFISAAFAGGEASVVPVDDTYQSDLAVTQEVYEADVHRVFDLMVDVWDADKATTFHATAYTWCVMDPLLCCGTFWEHPTGGDMQPPEGDFVYFGMKRFDTFWTCTEEWPNPDVDPSKNATTFAPGSPLQKEPCVYEAEWYTDPADPEVDGGLYTIARYNLVVDCEICPCPPGSVPPCQPEYQPGWIPCCYFTVEGEIYYASTGGIPWAFSVDVPICWCIPEPGSVALLALGGLALIRRR